jgi:hypothetical protein
MKEARAKIDAGDVCRDVIDKFPIIEGGSGPGGEFERASVYGGDEPASKQNSSRSAPVEEVVCAEGRYDLQEE